MPFTFSHPALVLGLNNRKYFSLTGLVLGSMMPDFEYFLRMRIKGDFSHSLAGMFFFCLPLALLVSFIYHNWVRNNLIDNLPYFFKSRFYSFKTFDWTGYCIKNWYIVIASILFGVFSHNFWDAFTHSSGFFVRHFPALSNTTIPIIGYKPIPLYSFLQHFSSLVGALIILYVIYRIPRSLLVPKSINFSYWAAVIAVALLLFGLRFCLYTAPLTLGNGIAAGINSVMVSLILIECVIRLTVNKQLSR